ncbi:hypothetical protein ABT009_42670 [Streptomyces sp. NPDC002896]|uniref:hypothetical protein n=1 Tax=Streptomyces sp. NPDC002896 TaxID=3154438 RepID=UPI0033249777
MTTNECDDRGDWGGGCFDHGRSHHRFDHRDHRFDHRDHRFDHRFDYRFDYRFNQGFVIIVLPR